MRIFFFSALAVLAAGCATVDIQTDFNRNAPFPSYRTYDWLDQASSAAGLPLTQRPVVGERVRAAVDRELSAKGLRLQPGGGSDFLVAVYLVGHEKIDEATCGYSTGHWGHGSASGG